MLTTDSLANDPPAGLKHASCWQDSATAGDAQCTADCVSVTADNGTTFYPMVGGHAPFFAATSLTVSCRVAVFSKVTAVRLSVAALKVQACP